MEDARALQEIGWRQGSILSPQSLPPGCQLEPALLGYAEDACLIVHTQDCDLVQPHFTKEPFVELLSCEVRHEGQITLDDLQLFSEWDFDYLTHRETLQTS